MKIVLHIPGSFSESCGEASTATISHSTDKTLPLIQEWRSPPEGRVYHFVWLDAIHYKNRHEGRAIYCIIRLSQGGSKGLLGMYIWESQEAKFWLQILTDLQNREMENIFIASIDNLQGFANAIESILPRPKSSFVLYTSSTTARNTYLAKM